MALGPCIHRYAKRLSCFNLYLVGGNSELPYCFAGTMGPVDVHAPWSLYESIHEKAALKIIFA